jgi:hypothetical protein
MKAALSIDFGNSYTKVGIRREPNDTAQALRSEHDLKYDEDNLCIPTVAARLIENGKERWLYGTDVKPGSNRSDIQVFRNWKPLFFQGHETHLADGQISIKGRAPSNPDWETFSDTQLETLLKNENSGPDLKREVREVLDSRKSAPSEAKANFDYEAIGKGYFAWLRKFVEPFCELHGIGSTQEIPVRITIPSFGVNSAQARLTLETILRQTGWQPARKNPALPEPVANLIGTFSGGRNKVWQPKGIDSYSLVGMIGESTLYKAIRSFALGSGRSRPPIYWVMIADLGGYTTDFAMIGFDLDNVEIQQRGRRDGRRLLGDYSEPIGVHDLDKQVRAVLKEPHRLAYDGLAGDVDGLRIDRFHQAVYQNSRPYNTGKGIIGQDPKEKKAIEEVIRNFAESVADFADRFLLIEQYDHIDELILTGGGCNIPLLREAIRKKLAPYNLRNSHIPLSDQLPVPPGCRRLERMLVRGATALGATSVFFDYD